MAVISSWGRLGAWEHEIEILHSGQVAEQLKNRDKGIAYGMGRSYGDVCLNPHGLLWKTPGLDRFISFNEKTGRLVCEAGVLLYDINRLFRPRGWGLAVTPGTQMVTLGGAIANDVHGKNHHFLGSFGNHIQQLKLARTDGSFYECGPDLLPDWFAATVGGIGLTGVITEVDIQLAPFKGPWLKAEILPYTGLADFFQLVRESDMHWQYTVSWLDCFAKKNLRGLFMRANPCEEEPKITPASRQWTIPFAPPISLINPFSLRAFNALYFHSKKNQSLANPLFDESFLYPLDQVKHWNKMYGPKGFFQYQTVIPLATSLDAIQALLETIAKAREGSFLSVLKQFGSKPPLGMLSFPKPGVTLALDFPNRGSSTLKLFERLDAIVREAGGRNYLAKDARMPRDLFEAGYPRLAEFLPYRDPGISSAMSRRLIGD